jgi:hypothetical protein
MSKVNILIILASLFITGVMIFLSVEGVHLKERRMVKWSAVDSVELAGVKIARFMFPLINDKKVLSFSGPQPFTQDFFQGFSSQGHKNNPAARFVLGEQKESAFHIQIENLDQDFVEACRNGDRVSCIGVKAKNKFQKKERDTAKLWLNMYRVSEDEALLFFKKPVD